MQIKFYYKSIIIRQEIVIKIKVRCNLHCLLLNQMIFWSINLEICYDFCLVHFSSLNRHHTRCLLFVIQLIIWLKNLIENMKKSSKFTDAGKSNCSTPAPLKKRISLELVNPTNE